MLDPDLIPSICIFISFIFIVLHIYSDDNRNFKVLLILGLVIRLILMYGDYFGLFSVFGSGADSEKFHMQAIHNMYHLEKIGASNYKYFLDFIYRATSGSRLIAQYINLIMGFYAIVLIEKSLRYLEIKKEYYLFPMLVLLFLPVFNSSSVALLREAWIIFFVALSVYYFIKWFCQFGKINMIWSVLSVLCAAYMHSGVITILAGYFIAFATYDTNSFRVNLNAKSCTIIFLVLGVAIGLIPYMDQFTGKFAKLERAEDIIVMTNKINHGSSAYLQWINSDSLMESLMFAPLKMLYFLFSPLPTEWNSVINIIAFFIDGLFYLLLSYFCFSNRHYCTNKYRIFRNYLSISLFCVIFTFAYGTYNAGTAMRHRAKILSVLVIGYAVTRQCKTKSTHYNDKSIQE